jgi:hydroxyacylglutathione hydrolase
VISFDEFENFSKFCFRSFLFMALEIEKITVGPLQSNCILIYDSESKEAAVVDPGDEADRIIDRTKELGLKITSILLTHTHGDHIGAVGALKDFSGAPVYVHPEEKDWLDNPDKNLSALLGLPITAPAADKTMKDSDIIHIGSEKFEVLHTPGHSPGGVCFYRRGILISGDLLFRESIGRTDLPGGDMATIKKSLQSKIMKLPGETLCYPGHGDSTTIEHELKNNYFLRS